jgi:hypothetical protein
MIHFLRPLRVAFHADVALGSTWNEEPDRGAPIMSHLMMASEVESDEVECDVGQRVCVCVCACVCVWLGGGGGRSV